MQSAVAVDRLHFAFTVTYHYFFRSSPWAWRC